MAGITCIVGLGNPGSEYEKTRHNAGAWFVQQLSQHFEAPLKVDAKRKAQIGQLRYQESECRLVIPTDFMNLSGDTLSLVTQYYRVTPNTLLVAHDELDLPAGVIRLKYGGGHGGHNGLRDIVAKLGTPDFWRLRIGIAHPGHKSQVTNYVLKTPSQDDRIVIDTAIDSAEKVLADLLMGRFEKAMTALHTE